MNDKSAASCPQRCRCERRGPWSARVRRPTPRKCAVSDIRPGMVGIGRTVFSGTQVEEFKAHILGVIENVIGTQRNLILARLEGGPLAQHRRHRRHERQPGLHRRQVDRRRVVLARQLSQGTDRRHHADRGDDRCDGSIAAAPPGARVKRRVSAVARWTPRGVPEGAQLEPSVRRSARRRAIHRDDGSRRRRRTRDRDDAAADCDAARDVRLRTGRGRPAGRGISRSGIRADGAALRARHPGDAVRRPTQAGRRDRRHVRERRSRTRRDRHGHPHRRRSRLRIRPSDVQPRPDRVPDDARLRLHGAAEPVLVGEAVEHRRGDRHVHAGSRDRHRRPLGPGPSLLPVTMTLESDRGGKRTFKFGVVNDQLFTPLMTYTALVNTLGSYERQFGTASYAVAGTAASEEIRTSRLRQLFAGDNSPSNASAYVVAPITALINNDYENVRYRQPRADDQVDRGAAHGHARARVARRSATARRTDGAAESAAAHAIAARTCSAPFRSRSQPMRAARSR